MLVNLMLLIIVAGAAPGSKAINAGMVKFSDGKLVGRVESGLIREISGAAASRKNPGILWVHNDSGNAAKVYAITTAGKLAAIYTVTGVNSRDWEDIAVGPGPDPNRDYLYIGDIGDNSNDHKTVSIYRAVEPKISQGETVIESQTTPAQRLELSYPDGPHDAETLMVDPITRDIYIITKRDRFSKVYRAAWPQGADAKATLEKVAELSLPGATGGDISPAGDFIIVRGYYWIALWARPKEGDLAKTFSGLTVEIPVIWEPQGEAVCFDANGTGYFTLSEKVNQPIYYFERLDAASK